MWNYLKKSFQRKRARRITQEYPARVDAFALEKTGRVEFANWENPLIKSIELEQSGVDFFSQFIKPGDLAIDIGANIGENTVLMALAAGKNGCTLGFDPNPFVFKILSRNAQLNPNKTNIVAVNHAITVEPASFYYISSEASFANGGLSPNPTSPHGRFVHTEKVTGVNLHNFLQANHAAMLDRLRFIKVDTEGYDKEILKSIGTVIDQ
ncbi:MAG: FkbM family methyltransferase, partial [Bacteroidota bacterium]